MIANCLGTNVERKPLVSFPEDWVFNLKQLEQMLPAEPSMSWDHWTIIGWARYEIISLRMRIRQLENQVERLQCRVQHRERS